MRVCFDVRRWTNLVELCGCAVCGASHWRACVTRLVASAHRSSCCNAVSGQHLFSTRVPLLWVSHRVPIGIVPHIAEWGIVNILACYLWTICVTILSSTRHCVSKFGAFIRDAHP